MNEKLGAWSRESVKPTLPIRSKHLIRRCQISVILSKIKVSKSSAKEVEKSKDKKNSYGKQENN